MRILGIDPGSITLGYGIIELHNNDARYIASGCIRVGKQDWPNRLLQIYVDLSAIITQYAPVAAAIEQVFVHKNPAGALKLGQARGAAIVALASHNLPVAEYSAREVKQAVVGYGNADKAQVQHMIQVILRLTAPPSSSDAADALAVAICHSNCSKLIGYKTT